MILYNCSVFFVFLFWTFYFFRYLLLCTRMHSYSKTYWYTTLIILVNRCTHCIYAPLVMNCDRCSVFYFRLLGRWAVDFFHSAASKFCYIDMCLKCLCIIFFLWAFPSMFFIFLSILIIYYCVDTLFLRYIVKQMLALIFK